MQDWMYGKRCVVTFGWIKPPQEINRRLSTFVFSLFRHSFREQLYVCVLCMCACVCMFVRVCVCLQSSEAALYHKGRLDHGDVPVVAVCNSQSREVALKDSCLQPVVLPSDLGVKSVFGVDAKSTLGSKDSRHGMLALAIEISRNKDKGVKVIFASFLSS